MSNKEIWLDKFIWLLGGLSGGFFLGYALGLVEVERLYTAVLTALAKYL